MTPNPYNQFEIVDQAVWETIRLFLHQEHYSLIVSNTEFWTNFRSNYEEDNSEGNGWQTANKREEKTESRVKSAISILFQTSLL